MKNIFFSLLILSSSLIYSTDFKVNVKKKKELQPLHKQHISPSSLDDEQEMDLYIQALEEEEALNGAFDNQKCSSNGWNIIKNLAGLLIGTKFFFCGSKGVLFFAVCPDHILSDMISRSSITLSPVEKFLTNRFTWISLCSTLTVFSLWILKKSVTNLYKELYPTEDAMEY